MPDVSARIDRGKSQIIPDSAKGYLLEQRTLLAGEIATEVVKAGTNLTRHGTKYLSEIQNQIANLNKIIGQNDLAAAKRIIEADLAFADTQYADALARFETSGMAIWQAKQNRLKEMLQQFS